MSTKPGTSILVVDDEADICAVLKRGLQSEGFRVSTFTDPFLALEHFKEAHDEYGVVVSDVRMPRMSGFELAKKIKAINPRTKIVMMTAFEINKSEFSKVLPHLEVAGFLTKPISMQRMIQILKDVYHVGSEV
jgi:two-component system response regulator ChvI